jgi:Neutral/alkaline non-lysosomal ceramidase, N-terminal
MAAAPELTIQDSEFAGTMGVARADITPPAGIYARCWGSSTHDIASGVHKPLLATCVTFGDTQGQNVLVLLALDLSWWSSKQDELELRTAILTGAGLLEQELIFHPSHTHSAPRTATEFANRPGGNLIPEYRALIKSTCIDLIAKARDSMVPGTLTWRSGRCALAYNRDLRSPADGRVLCGLNPAAPADDTLLVGRFVDLEGKVRSTFVNYACHPISLGGGNTLVSPDYVGSMRETIEAAMRGGECVFLHGASGNQAPRRSFESDVRIADQNGREVGYSALSVLTSMFPPQVSLDFSEVQESGTPLAIWREHRTVAGTTIRSRRVTVRLAIADIPSREELQAQIANATEDFMVERLTRRLLQRESVGDGAEGDFSFLVWQLGDSFIVGTPAEMHTSFQLRLRQRFPSSSIAVLNIVNGYASYLPPQEDYAVGPYPVHVAVYKMGSMETVLEAAGGAIRDMLNRG